MPNPMPYPENPEAPRPKPFRYIPGPLACTGGEGRTDCHGEANCGAGAQLSRAVHGRPFTVAGQYIPDDPRKIFRGGGSENWAPSWAAVKYYKDQGPKWWESYCDIQLSGEVPIFGREIFSEYLAITVGNWLTARKLAEKLGHKPLMGKLALLLRSYWTALALMATQDSTRTYRAWHFDEESGKDSFGSEPVKPFGGFGIAAPANRAYVNHTTSGVGVQGLLLSLALDHPTRIYTWNLNQAGGRPLCAFMKALYYPYNAATGKVDVRSVTPAATDFGLTTAERHTLKQFLLSGGTRGLDVLISWLKPYKLGCHLTIWRTDHGVTSAFVPPTGERVGLCSRVKGGTFVAVTLDTFVATSLSRATRENQPEEAWAWFKDGKVYEESAQREVKSIDLVTGNPIYRLYWPRDGQIAVN